jgi:uncharacterized protein YdeI (YjbR/CyaY-like superfamily)
MKIFAGASDFRDWLQKNHDKEQELVLGIYNQSGDKISVTYRQALDEALCFGWIDGVRHSVDETTYTVRFTPRKARSYWSAVNIRRFAELEKLGRVRPAGQAAFNQRSQESGKYSFENRTGELDGALEKQFKANKKAWEFFKAQPPGYQRTAAFWVMSAKREETRLNRLGTLIKDSAAVRRLKMLTPKAKKSS